jgi:hypothetical protein
LRWPTWRFAQSAEDVVLVKFDSLLAQVQLIGDLLDGIALREQLENIALPDR